MVSVIEHQKVERRRRVRKKLDFRNTSRHSTAASLSSGLLAAGTRRRRAPAGGHGVPRRRFADRRPTGTRRQRLVSLGARLWRSIAPAIAGATDSTVSTGGRLLRGLGSSLISLERRDYPVLTAAVAFAVLANMMLLSFGADRILMSGAVTQITLPPQTDLVARSALAPERDSFAVIGEVASVDPARFARLEVSTYEVQPGDTLGEIAASYDLEMDTLISFNQIEDVRRLQVGDTFQIPNRDGLLYTVKRGDTMASIAAANGTTVNAILDANDLRSVEIAEGQVLFVPGARLNQTELRIILGELFAWPTRGTFTSGFGMRADPFTGLPRFHNGIDLANRIGTPIRAAASGRVVHVESQIGNYGRFVIVRHPDGFQTLYAHLQDFSVRTGQYVDRGQRLGTMGNTGRSTGPHLHFSVIHNGTFVNPLRYLH